MAYLPRCRGIQATRGRCGACGALWRGRGRAGAAAAAAAGISGAEFFLAGGSGFLRLELVLLVARGKSI